MNLLDISIALPLLLLAIGALVTLLTGAITGKQGAGYLIAILVAIGAGLWAMRPPPVLLAPNLGLSASGLSRFFTVYFCFMAAAVLIVSYKYNQSRDLYGEEYPATVLFATFGMVALAAATDMLLLFLGLEAMTFGFYILTAIDREREVAAEAGLKYLLLGALSAAFLAFGIGLLYCVGGTLAIDDLMRSTLAATSQRPLALAGWAFVLLGIGFKLSLVPAHLWAPDVYEAAPPPVVAFLSAGSKVAAILLLLFLLQGAGDSVILRVPLFALAVGSMVVGNLAALRQNRVRRMLAYSSIAQMGYVVVALLSQQGNGLQAAAFYAIGYGVMNLAAFGAITILETSGCGAEIDAYRGRGFSQPIPSAVLAVSLLALAGIPPTVGFTGKFLIFASALRAGETSLAVIGILTAAVSIYYYLRLVAALYLHQAAEQPARSAITAQLVPVLAAVLTVLLGVFPERLLLFLQAQFF